MQTPIFSLSFLSALALSGALCGCASAQNEATTPGVAAPVPAKVAAPSDIPSGILTQPAQVWIGGSRAWPDFIRLQATKKQTTSLEIFPKMFETRAKWV